MNWEIDDGLTIDDYTDMERKRMKKYPECTRCKRKFVKTEKEQDKCKICIKYLETRTDTVIENTEPIIKVTL